MRLYIFPFLTCIFIDCVFSTTTTPMMYNFTANLTNTFTNESLESLMYKNTSSNSTILLAHSTKSDFCSEYSLENCGSDTLLYYHYCTSHKECAGAMTTIGVILSVFVGLVGAVLLSLVLCCYFGSKACSWCCYGCATANRRKQVVVAAPAGPSTQVITVTAPAAAPPPPAPAPAPSQNIIMNNLTSCPQMMQPMMMPQCQPQYPAPMPQPQYAPQSQYQPQPQYQPQASMAPPQPQYQPQPAPAAPQPQYQPQPQPQYAAPVSQPQPAPVPQPQPVPAAQPQPAPAAQTQPAPAPQPQPPPPYQATAASEVKT